MVQFSPSMHLGVVINWMTLVSPSSKANNADVSFTKPRRSPAPGLLFATRHLQVQCFNSFSRYQPAIGSFASASRSVLAAAVGDDGLFHPDAGSERCCRKFHPHVAEQGILSSAC